MVVWNSGPEGAAMADFAYEEWTQVVGVETSNVGKRCILACPGASDATSLRLDAVPLHGRSAS